ncbi:TonB-dependent receptor [Sphingomonas sp. MG17]|uniref:TonB-dependent receptor n=1 Tax=Sphingomonas tagetis TaxID=2949092 RepID=A0A9X2KNU9_9SPHN|nr:TonB-dependent receptor [Sphingomonas tagetis]MCP3730003.1 TonB-dependent receptor [Sphingomonas tagetis]
MRKIRMGSNPRRQLGTWFAAGSSLALAAVFAAPGVAQAETADPAPVAAPAQDADAGDGAQIADIVVTARRVEERQQDIPASVAAITGDELGGMASLADIQSKVSGVTFQVIGPVPVIGIRGFGNRSAAGNPSNSAVGIFQDGVFVAPTLSTVINRTDTERVEVAKGPQSTLYGRASFTGAFNIATADPAKEFSGYLDAGAGVSSTHGDTMWRVQGAVSLPLSDTLSVRLYGLAEKREGYVYDPVTDIHSAGYDRQIGRIRVLWEPSDAVAIRLTGAIYRDDLPLPFVTAGLVRAPLGQSVVFANPASAASRAALVFAPNVWRGQLQTEQHGKIRGEQVTLDMRFQTPFGEFASLSDYQHSTLDPFFSLDNTRLNWANGSSPYYEKRFSQELRVSDKAGPWNYIFGVYLLHSDVEQGGGKIFDTTRPFASFMPGSVQYDLGNVNALYQPSYTETFSYAAFGQVGYDITDQLNLNVGLRWGRDEISGTAGVAIRNRLANLVIPTVPMVYRAANFNAVTGSANLSYKITPAVMVYASYAKGNSPGGLNTGAVARINYGPQNVDAYELGLKSQFLDRRLQLNVALFDNEYSGLQLAQNIIVNGAITPIISNAAKARGRGVDLDATAVVSRNLRLGLQYTYVDSKITQYSLPAPPSPQVNLTGVPLVRSPKHSLNGSVTFSHDVGPGTFELTAQETYSSSYTNDYQGVPAGTAYPGIPGVLPAGTTTSQVLGLYRVKGYALTNLNASFSWGNFEIRGSVRNLFNKQYIATALAFDMVTVPLETPGAPRTFEASVRVKF